MGPRSHLQVLQTNRTSEGGSRWSPEPTGRAITSGRKAAAQERTLPPTRVRGRKEKTKEAEGGAEPKAEQGQAEEMLPEKRVDADAHRRQG